MKARNSTMYRCASFLMCTVLMVTMLASGGWASAAEGAPISINTQAEFDALRGQKITGDYRLETNIAMGDEKSITSFSGSFDGNGYTVTVGGNSIFGAVAATGATIKNLNVTFEGVSGRIAPETAAVVNLMYLGGGKTGEPVLFDNVHVVVTGAVASTGKSVAGMVGNIAGFPTTFSNCSVTLETGGSLAMTGGKADDACVAGGFVGCARTSATTPLTIQNSYVYLKSGSSIMSSYPAALGGKGYCGAGGFVGAVNGREAALQNCYAIVESGASITSDIDATQISVAGAGAMAGIQYGGPDARLNVSNSYIAADGTILHNRSGAPYTKNGLLVGGGSALVTGVYSGVYCSKGADATATVPNDVTELTGVSAVDPATYTGWTFGTGAWGQCAGVSPAGNTAAAYVAWPFLNWETTYLTGISVATPPTKLAYTAGETFDPAGMVVTATYNDGTSKPVTVDAPTTALTAGDTAVTVSYTVGNVTKTATVTITVTDAVTSPLTGITVTAQPTKTTYAVGETFDPTGMEVTATYNDGTSKPVTGYTTTPATALTAGDTAVTVSYTVGGVTMTATVAITVTAAATQKQLNLSDGSITITATGYIQGAGEETAYTGEYMISGTSDANIVKVTGGTHKITLENATITSTAVSPFQILGGNVTLMLEGTNKLETSAAGMSALQVLTGASLKIDAADNNQTLSASGTGNKGNGIGGISWLDKAGVDAGQIEIAGGSVTAQGMTNGDRPYWSGVGIGGGYSHTCAGIKISGGVVNAIGGAVGIGTSAAKGMNTIELIGGTITATGACAGIGCPELNHKGVYAPNLCCERLTIENCSVNATTRAKVTANKADANVYRVTLTAAAIANSDVSITVDSGTTFTSKANADGNLYLYLSEGAHTVSATLGDKTYAATGVAVTPDGTATAALTEVLPSYDLAVTTTPGFADATEGYAQPVAQNIVFTNSGNRAQDIEFVVAGANAADFAVDSTAQTGVAAGAAFNVSVQPNAKLAVGTYTVTVQAKSANNLTGATATVTFTVTEQPKFALTFTVANSTEKYHAGDTITADIYLAYPGGESIGSFGTTVGCDSAYLTLTDLVAETGFTAYKETGKVALVDLNQDGFAVAATGTKLATATFTVKSDFPDSGAANLTFAKSNIGALNGTDLSGAITATSTPVNVVKQYTVTFAAGENGMIPATTPKAFDADYLLTAADIPTPTANATYKFAGWQVGAEATLLDTLVDYKVTGDVTITATFVSDTVDVTFYNADANNALISTVPTVIGVVPVAPTAAREGYTFEGWFAVTDPTAKYNATTDTLLTTLPAATAAASYKAVYTYNLNSTVKNATIAVTAGATGDVIAQGTDITFTVAHTADYAAPTVTYTVDGANKGVLTANNGIYTISAADVTGHVAIQAICEIDAIVTMPTFGVKPAGEKFVKVEGNPGEGKGYSIGGATLYCSKPGTYVGFVADTYDEVTAKAALTITSTPATPVTEGGDIDGNLKLLPNDARIVHTYYNGYGTYKVADDMHYLMMDYNMDGVVGPADVLAMIQAYLKA